MNAGLGALPPAGPGQSPGLASFIIAYRAREGSSPIIDLLGHHPGLNVPIFEQLDHYSLAGTVSGDDIGALAGLTLATGDLATALRLHRSRAAPPAGDGRPVGFKWRIWGTPDRVVQALAERQVVVFHLFRRRLRQLVTSHLLTDTVIPELERSTGIDLQGGGHLQFKLADMSPGDRDRFRSRLAALRFRLDPAAFLALAREIVASKQETHDRYLAPLRRLGVPVYAVLYEDFVADRQAFLAMIHRAIGLDPAPHTPAGHFHKVLTANPVRQVDNWSEVTALPELRDVVADYHRLIRGHVCLRPLVMEAADAG